jgi:hypothetical protein
MFQQVMSAKEMGVEIIWFGERFLADVASPRVRLVDKFLQLHLVVHGAAVARQVQML